MPRTTSAKKALRGSQTKRARNLVQAARLDHVLRMFARATEHTTTDLRGVQKALDKATKTGLLQPARANRIKSRIMRPIKLAADPAPTEKPTKRASVKRTSPKKRTASKKN